VKLSQKQILLIGGAFVVVVGLVVAVFFLGGRKVAPPEVKLTVWGTEPASAFRTLFEDYHRRVPNVTVSYTQLPITNYEQAILESLAAGQGPDIFQIRNRDLLPNLNKLAPAPPAFMSLTQVRALFPTVVEDDFVWNGAVYALPLSIDTLALFYNRDHFDAAAIVSPPATWEAFVENVRTLRKLGAEGKVVRAGAALGGSARTVEEASDIVQLLMLQNGASPQAPASTPAAVAAFNFYLQFANAGSNAYTWHDAMVPAREAFAVGNAAMLVNYRASLADLARKNPFLRIGVAPVPQTHNSQPVSFARYQGFAVSKWSRWAGDWAWRFVADVTTTPELVGVYLASGVLPGQAGAPPALRAFIAGRLEDPELGTFAKQALTARSWQAPGDARVRAAFDAAIQNVLTGRTDSHTALQRAGAELQSR
jgi:multiple sugar transport system substrate-binding protein